MSDDDPYFPKLHQLKGIAVGLNDEMRLLFDAFVSGSASDAHLDRFLDIRKEARDAANEVDNEMQRLEDEYESKTAATSSTRTALFRSKLDEEDLLDGGASQLVRLVQNSIDELERAQTDYFKKLRASRTINPSSAANSQQQTASNIEIQPEASGQQMKVDLSTLTAGTGSLNLVIKYPNQGFRPSTDAIPLFDGNAADFGTFWNLFEPIHLDQSISVQAKFNMLFSKLGPSIKKNFRAYGSTTANYNLIVNELRATYGNPTASIEELSERLYELPIHDNKRSDDWQTFRTIQSIVNQLEYLGADIDNFLVFKAVSQRIPSRIFDEVIKRRTPKTTKEYMAAATEIFHSYEELEKAYARSTTSRRHDDSPRPRPQKNRSTTERCVFCGKHGSNQDCRSVAAVDERRRILQTQRRCFRCLSADHLSRECQAVCSKCQGHHHAYICAPAAAQQPQQQQPRQAVQARGQQQQRPPAAPEQARHVATVTTTPDNHPEDVILVTAATMIQNPTTRLAKEARAFIDIGSQASFMLRDLAEDLHIQPTEFINTTIAPFNSPPVTLTTPIATVRLQMADHSWKPLKVRIVDDLPKNLKHYESDSAASLQSSLFPVQTPIIGEATPGILIGMDQLTKITDLVITADQTTGSSKITTAFGDSMAGPIATPEPQTLTTNSVTVGTIVVAEEDKTRHELESLWTLDALGVHEDAADAVAR